MTNRVYESYFEHGCGAEGLNEAVAAVAVAVNNIMNATTGVGTDGGVSTALTRTPEFPNDNGDWYQQAPVQRIPSPFKVRSFMGFVGALQYAHVENR